MKFEYEMTPRTKAFSEFLTSEGIPHYISSVRLMDTIAGIELPSTPVMEDNIVINVPSSSLLSDIHTIIRKQYESWATEQSAPKLRIQKEQAGINCFPFRFVDVNNANRICIYRDKNKDMYTVCYTIEGSKFIVPSPLAGVFWNPETKDLQYMFGPNAISMAEEMVVNKKLEGFESVSNWDFDELLPFNLQIQLRHYIYQRNGWVIAEEDKNMIEQSAGKYLRYYTNSMFYRGTIYEQDKVFYRDEILFGPLSKFLLTSAARRYDLLALTYKEFLNINMNSRTLGKDYLIMDTFDALGRVIKLLNKHRKPRYLLYAAILYFAMQSQVNKPDEVTFVRLNKSLITKYVTDLAAELGKGPEFVTKMTNVLLAMNSNPYPFTSSKILDRYYVNNSLPEALIAIELQTYIMQALTDTLAVAKSSMVNKLIPYKESAARVESLQLNIPQNIVEEFSNQKGYKTALKQVKLAVLFNSIANKEKLVGKAIRAGVLEYQEGLKAILNSTIETPLTYSYKIKNKTLETDVATFTTFVLDRAG